MMTIGKQHCDIIMLSQVVAQAFYHCDLSKLSDQGFLPLWPQQAQWHGIFTTVTPASSVIWALHHCDLSMLSHAVIPIL